MFWQFWHLVTSQNDDLKSVNPPGAAAIHESSCYTGNCWVQIVFPFENTGSKGLSRICCSLARELDRPKRHGLYMMVIQHGESSPSIHTYLFYLKYHILYIDTFLKTPLTETWHGCESPILAYLCVVVLVEVFLPEVASQQGQSYEITHRVHYGCQRHFKTRDHRRNLTWSIDIIEKCSRYVLLRHSINTAKIKNQFNNSNLCSCISLLIIIFLPPPQKKKHTDTH